MSAIANIKNISHLHLATFAQNFIDEVLDKEQKEKIIKALKNKDENTIENKALLSTAVTNFIEGASQKSGEKFTEYSFGF